MFNALMPQIRMPSVRRSVTEPLLAQQFGNALASYLESRAPLAMQHRPTAMPGAGYEVTPTDGLVSQIAPDDARPYAINRGEAPATGDWLRMANQGATRDDPLSDRLVQTLAAFVPQMGVEVEVFSGGQGPAGSGDARTGSTRHDHGHAADIYLYRGGRRLNWADPQDRPVFAEFVRRGRQAGLTGIGAGPGYMGEGSMHIGFGAPAVWGDGGRSANAPDWLRRAYYG